MAQVGLIGVDPGVTTGIAWGRYNPALRDKTGLWNALGKGRGTGCVEVTVPDDIVAGGLAVLVIVWDVIADFSLRGVGVDEVFVFIEDFQADPAKVRGGTVRDKLAPVGVGMMLAGSLASRGFGNQWVWQMPSLAKHKANDDRLKRWGELTQGRAGWVRGKVHTRDAWRHLATGFESVP